MCDHCFKRFVETYEFRKQCIWALNYWKNLDHHIENEDKIEKSYMPVIEAFLDVKSTLPLDEDLHSELNNMHTKAEKLNEIGNIIIDINNDNNNNIINVNYEDKTKSISKIQVNINEGKKPILAKVCPYCGVSRKYLSKHLLIHKMSQFICDFCGKTFQKKFNLYRHTRIHVNVR